MEENLEVYFCELCSESIPLKDMETRTARQIKGKVIGACCLQELAPKTGKGGGAGGLTTLGVIFLAGLAGATIWIEFRLSSTTGDLGGRLARLSTSVDDQNGMWGSMEKRLDQFADKTAQAMMRTTIDQVEEKLDSVTTIVRKLDASQDGSKLQIASLDDRVDRVRDVQTDIVTRLQVIQSELRLLSQEVAKVAAMPRNASAPRGAGLEDEAMKPAPAVDDGSAGLPKALRHQIVRLKDEDAGNRFEAVDQLIQSKNPKVREHLLPMLKDPDMFVRRLTAEGLGKFKHASCVEALIVALADPEGIVRHTAHSSLKKLTGQKIPFDSEASGRARRAAQRKWKEWWAKGKKDF